MDNETRFKFATLGAVLSILNEEELEVFYSFLSEDEMEKLENLSKEFVSSDINNDDFIKYLADKFKELI